MGIEILYEDEELSAIKIDGETFFSEGDGNVVVPKKVLATQNLADFPQGLRVELCESICDDNIFINNIPTTISKTSTDTFLVEFSDMHYRKYWDAPVGLKLYMETKRDIIIERERELKDVKFESFDDDGAYITLDYSTSITVDSFAELFSFIDQIYAEIEGATDIALGSPFEKIENCKKEDDFTTKILIPLIRKLGFANVKYNHGTAEFGKDITFARLTEFEEYEYWGVQVKFGDVSGSAAGDINELLIQAKDAFSMPFYDVYTRQKRRISKLIIAISGRFTKNAIEKIIEGLTDYPLKNNIVFLDGEKINTLIERYRKSL